MLSAAERPLPETNERPLQVCVVVPTLNEVGNVAELLRRLDRALIDYEWEAIFVDDGSCDGTPEQISTLACGDRRIRLIQRVGRRGLASAVIEGALASLAPVIAVIDADLQHDEQKLPLMVNAVTDDGRDVAIGSRYCEGGSTGSWGTQRLGMSRLATRLAELVTRTRVTDPMSGFFVIRRQTLLAIAPRLSTVGYKILLDVLASSPTPLNVTEIPYEFRDRLHGQSKLDHAVLLEYGELLLDKMFGRWIPPKLIMFGAIGTIGVIVHLALLGGLLRGLGTSFAVAQSGAVIGAMTFNFILNNKLTYHDRQLKGGAFVRGLIIFYLVCAVGAIGNVGIGSLVYRHISMWWLAGLAGAVVGSVWNYAASSWLTWTKR